METIERKIEELLEKLDGLKECGGEARALPSESYFINADEIACLPRRFGDSRYPYSRDGLILWANASGNIRAEESDYTIFRDTTGGAEPDLCFYFGIKSDGEYFPVSVTGAGKFAFEKGAERYTVYTPESVYYIVRKDGLTAAVRAFTDVDKNMRFTVYAANGGTYEREIYLSAFFDPLLSHSNVVNIETKWYKSCRKTENGYLFRVTEYFNRETCQKHEMYIARSGEVHGIRCTTSRAVYCGGTNELLSNSSALIAGRFAEEKDYTEFTETAAAGDIVPLKLGAGKSFTLGYTLALSDEGDAERKAEKNASVGYADRLLYSPKAKSESEVGSLLPQIGFEGMDEIGLDGKTFTYFIKNVLRQTEFCARAKNYAGPLIGIRDIFQQLEAALMWIPGYCGGKMTEALGFIGEDGRAPRQYSYPASAGILPAMDLRPYIDQGVWIISAVHTYLRYTGDFSLLERECGYYRFDGYRVGFSERKDSVLEHLIAITDFLLSHVDEETFCLHALYGDWNDALDGLGKTEDEGKEYGTGVSVMATLQLYRNLGEMCEILDKVGGHGKERSKYAEFRQKICEGIERNAVVEREGKKKLVHGWGDKRSYFIAGFEDGDGANRDGLTSNAFYVLSGAIEKHPERKEDILRAYKRLDSKYGIKTFEPYFSEENRQAGRITHLPKGTAENGAVYIHATLFAIWSLFELGESRAAWEQLYKILPLTHEFISTTPFVMPNSYIYNEEKGFDGESMSDWFTGSGSVLVKVLAWEVFGVRADFDGLTICPAAYFPAARASITLQVCGSEITVNYKKEKRGHREFKVNGEPVPAVYDEGIKAYKTEIRKSAFAGKKLTVDVTD